MQCALQEAFGSMHWASIACHNQIYECAGLADCLPQDNKFVMFPAFWESHRAMPAPRTAPFASTRWVSLSHKSLLCACKPSDTLETWSQDVHVCTFGTETDCYVACCLPLLCAVSRMVQG